MVQAGRLMIRPWGRCCSTSWMGSSDVAPEGGTGERGHGFSQAASTSFLFDRGARMATHLVLGGEICDRCGDAEDCPEKGGARGGMESAEVEEKHNGARKAPGWPRQSWEPMPVRVPCS